MDDHRFAAALTDAELDAALDGELEAALSVDPSPEFAARVRTRVQRERDAAASSWRWGIAAAVAVVAMIALVVAMSRPDRARIAQDENAARRQPAAARTAPDLGPGPVAQDSTASEALKSVPTRVLGTSGGRRSRPSAVVREPELLIAADEARALRQLFSNVRRGLVDLSSLQESPPATAALQPPSEISFSPITFEPIAAEAAEEGERQ